MDNLPSITLLITFQPAHTQFSSPFSPPERSRLSFREWFLYNTGWFSQLHRNLAWQLRGGLFIQFFVKYSRQLFWFWGPSPWRFWFRSPKPSFHMERIQFDWRLHYFKQSYLSPLILPVLSTPSTDWLHPPWTYWSCMCSHLYPCTHVCWALSMWSKSRLGCWVMMAVVRLRRMSVTGWGRGSLMGKWREIRIGTY